MALAAVAAIAPEASAKPAKGVRVVLPDAVTPEHYRLDVTPDVQALTFKGTVEIDVTVHRPTDRIVLNSADIVITGAALAGVAEAPKISYGKEDETAAFTFSRKLAAGGYTLRLAYEGRIFKQASGLFALDYSTATGQASALFTQFENSDARRFLPCWDEPGRKATFALTATVAADQMPISNMPVASIDALPGGLKRVHFAVTPKMSSYLLFFGSGDFERVHREVGGVDVGVVVKRGDTANAAFALDAAVEILPFYNNYFGTPYPLPKLDLVAGPGSSQFFGAMENWGAIFYFERAVLIDSRVSTESDKQNVYVTIAHEMAHMWFGDLVTMSWWDDLWLNEGFATWMMNKVTDHFHPQWRVWLQALGPKQGAMNVDAREGTHPIITEINDVMQAAGAFDTITYEKGAAVIQTLEAYTGEDAFRDGVRRYMRDHAYGNTVTDELWKEIDAGARLPITRIAHDLTRQAGVPLLTEVSSKCAEGNTMLGLSQGHFAIDAASTNARIWSLPVTVATIGDAPAKAVVAGSATHVVKVEGCGPVILNTGQTAYLRSRYSSDGMKAIAASFAALSAYDQLGVLNDSASLAYVGMEPMAALLDLTQRVPADADPVVVSALADRLAGLDRIYQGLPGQAAFRAYASGVLNPLFARIGWDKAAGESDNTAVLRADLIAALGDFGDPAVLAEAQRRYQRYLADAASLDAGTRRSTLRVVATHADQAAWEQLHAMAKSAKSQLERQEYYGLLGIAFDRNLAQQALALAMSGEPPTTIGPEIVNRVSQRHPGMAFDFAVAHWNEIGPMIEPTTLPRYMPRLLSSAFDPELIGKLGAFAAAHIPPSAHQDVRKAQALIRYLAKIRKKRLPEADRWLQGRRG